VVAGGRLLRQEADGSLATVAEFGGIAEVVNEIVVDGGGHVYVNGGSFDFSKPGVIAVVSPNKSLGAGVGETVRQVADGIEFGNGMAVTEDGTTLIVAESWGCRLTAFDLEPDGGLSNRRVWADLGDGHPDGICLDAEGAVWYADVPAQRCVRVREGGEVVQTVDLDRGAFACMLGGPTGDTLFMVAAKWRGFEHMLSDDRTGQLLTTQAPNPHAGKP
jgi:sugar lactone lactonase YvrE